MAQALGAPAGQQAAPAAQVAELQATIASMRAELDAYKQGRVPDALMEPGLTDREYEALGQEALQADGLAATPAHGPEDVQQPSIAPHWQKENRPQDLLHSSMGPSIDNLSKKIYCEPTSEHINPVTHDWSVHKDKVTATQCKAGYQRLAQAQPSPTKADFTIESLQDDHQALFVTVVLERVREIFKAKR